MTGYKVYWWIDDAILIYGPRKGGTTLFQNLLDGGRHVFVYPAELKLKYFTDVSELSPSEYFSNTKVPTNSRIAVPKSTSDGDWDAEAYFRHSRKYSVSAAAFDRAAYEAQWKADPDTRLAVGDLIRRDAIRVFENSRFRGVEPRGWCAKEVGGNSRRILHLWRRIFPKGRLLLISRDPRMVVRSILQDRRRVKQRLSLWNLLKQVYEPLAVNAAIAELAGNPDVHVIRYEDLVRDVRGVMKSVAAFLDIPFDEIFTRPTLLGDDVVVRTSSRVEKSVFVSAARWTDGLTSREKLVVGTVYNVLRLWFALGGANVASRR